MPREDQISPYLKRPLRSLEEVLRQRAERLPQPRQDVQIPAADNSNGCPPPAKTA